MGGQGESALSDARRCRLGSVSQRSDGRHCMLTVGLHLEFGVDVLDLIDRCGLQPPTQERRLSTTGAQRPAGQQPWQPEHGKHGEHCWWGSTLQLMCSTSTGLESRMDWHSGGQNSERLAATSTGNCRAGRHCMLVCAHLRRAALNVGLEANPVFRRRPQRAVTATHQQDRSTAVVRGSCRGRGSSCGAVGGRCGGGPMRWGLRAPHVDAVDVVPVVDI